MRMKSFAVLPLFVLALAGCASSSGSDDKDASSLNLTEPVVQLAQLSTVAEAARHVTGGIPIQYRVQVENPSSESITLKRVTVQSVGVGAYTMPNTSRPFSIEVPPNGTKAVDFWANGVVESDTVYGSNGPVSLRVTAFFESAKGSFQHTAVEQVHYEPTVGH
ncbi:MAG: hypothetical protein QOI24_3909 [Acidobacteriota bacterium]|nr:hypothetical protein [Acidobacteriota bacterium]